jgi:FHA domain-containing protein
VLPAPAPPAAPSSDKPADPFAGLGLSPPSADDPLAGFLAGTAPAVARAPQPASAPVVPPPVVAQVAAPATAPRPKPDAVPVAAAAVASASAATAASASSASHASDELWAAFCEGAGVPLQSQRLDTDQMRMLGMMMREAVDGVVRLMALRAVAKSELRAAVTTIRATNNNPMKFSPDVEVALRQMLQPPVRGFMPGPAAMQDAMHDLVGHTIGTMAGMRAALAGVLERFEPAQLEGKLATGSMLDNLLPGGRKAKLWDLYLKHFGAIRNDAQDDFHTLFGKAFVAAYEAQLDQLQAPRG